MTTRIAFIGGGNMARSLIGGLIRQGRSRASIHVAEPNAALRDALTQDFGVITHRDNLAAALACDIWVLAVKPQVMPQVLTQLAPAATDRALWWCRLPRASPTTAWLPRSASVRGWCAACPIRRR